MSKNDVQIIPPPRPAPAGSRDVIPTPRIPPPRTDTGGIIESTLTRWVAGHQTRALDTLHARTRSQTKLLEAEAEAMEAYVKRQRAGFHLQELPEILANDRAKRRAERAEDLRQVQHKYEVSEIGRLTEVARAEAVLVDAQQALVAQREFGFTNYELAWKKKHSEMLDVELGEAERREMLREHFAEIDSRKRRGRAALAAPISDDLDALYDARSQMLAGGLDTSKIDTLIDERKRKG